MPTTETYPLSLRQCKQVCLTTPSGESHSTQELWTGGDSTMKFLCGGRHEDVWRRLLAATLNEA